jgi:hypothetical protein
MNDERPFLPAPLQDLIDLFQGPLASVAFPDVDTLALTRLLAEVEAAHAGVVEAEAALAEARRERETCLDALTQKAQRALAYARVFAEDDAELSARLATIRLPQTSQSARGSSPGIPPESLAAAPRKRGRPRKVQSEALQMPELAPMGA